MVENKKLENETNEEKVPETVQNEFMLQLEDESKLSDLKNSIIEKYYGDSFNTELWKFGQSLTVEQLNDLAKLCKKNFMPLANFEDGRLSLILAETANRSLKTKKLEKIKF